MLGSFARGGRSRGVHMAAGAMTRGGRRGAAHAAQAGARTSRSVVRRAARYTGIGVVGGAVGVAGIARTNDPRRWTGGPASGGIGGGGRY